MAKDENKEWADRLGVGKGFNAKMKAMTKALSSESEREWRRNLKPGRRAYMVCALYGYCIPVKVNRIGRLNIQAGDNVHDTFRIETGIRSHGNTAMAIFSKPYHVDGLNQKVAKHTPLKAPRELASHA